MAEEVEVAAFDRSCARHLMKYGYQRVCEHLVALGLTGGPVVDLGCGGGHMAATLAEHGFGPVVGLDLSAPMLRRACDRTTLLPVQGDAAVTPFGDNTFTAAVSFASMHHWRLGPIPTLREARRIVAPGGYVVVLDLKRDRSLLRVARYIESEARCLFVDSVRAAYTQQEIGDALRSDPHLCGWEVREETMTVCVIGRVREEAS
jgi:ubiquinone/menaquinone biosynthesis C-methylase UbiE